jgi:hypothetical protein
VNGGEGNPGYIYISSNYGSTWTSVASSQIWTSVSMSASGQYQIACENRYRYVYVSSDYGSSWTLVKTVSGSNFATAVSASGQYISMTGYHSIVSILYTCQNSIANGVVSVGNYSSTSGVTGTTGSIYYDTTDSVLKVSNGSGWTSLASGSGIAGVTALGSSGFTAGATLTSDNYLQMAYAIGGGTANTYPGLMPGSYSDIFSTQTIDLANFGQNWIQNTTLSTSTNWYRVATSASGQYQTACVYQGSIWISSDYGNNWT